MNVVAYLRVSSLTALIEVPADMLIEIPQL